MEMQIEESWKQHINEEFRKDYFKKLVSFLKDEYREQIVFPPETKIFHAFNLCPFERVKVVIIGQDPYHGPGQAHGLCFSVSDGLSFPPSLRNIFKEIQNDLGSPLPESGDLSRWAKQGVFLMNASLTVRAHQAGSHQKKGWETFTDAVIKKIATEKENVVFLLWGAYAQKKAEFIDPSRHLVLKSVHPSPLSASRGFFGNRHFSKTNKYLTKNRLDPIQW